MCRLSCLLLFLLGTCRCIAGAGPGILPVYIEDNHAGTFAWIASAADLSQPHVLVLVDAHSDASAVDHSDEIRAGLRQVASEKQRATRIEEWRQSGRVQAFNWIEPLMPNPVSEVVWLARWDLSRAQKISLRNEASEQVDGRMEFEARASGELGPKWRVIDHADFERWTPPKLPVIVSIDLDFFSGLTNEVAAARFHQIWKSVLEIPQLRAVTFAISRPWQRSDDEAFQLLQTALSELRLVRGARVQFEPFVAAARDDSLKAEELQQTGREVPRFAVERVPAALKQLILQMRTNIRVEQEPERWDALLREWAEEIPAWKIIAEAGQVSTDGALRIPVEQTLPALRVWSADSTNTPSRCRWWLLKPVRTAFNVLADPHLGKQWTVGAGAFVHDSRTEIAVTTDVALAGGAWRKFLDRQSGLGVVRLEAEVETEQGWIRTAPIELRVTSGAGFHAGLSEQFGLPYVFGIGLAGDSELNGPDLGWGNDCANFLVSAWRRTGVPLPWCNPAQLRTRLRTLARGATPASRVAFTTKEAERGLVIDFGSHMAALWEDRPPKQVLDASDIVAHHLGATPELITLRELAKGRPRFAVHTLPSEISCRVAIGGDVVLAEAEKSDLQFVKDEAARMDLVVVNLEGLPVSAPVASAARYNFTFPAERLSWLRDAGVDLVGMANNHTGDGGLRSIEAAVGMEFPPGLARTGVGLGLAEAVRPWFVEKHGVRFEFLAVSLVEATAAEEGSAGVVVLPEHAEKVEEVIRAAKEDGRTVVVLAHWGREYSGKVEDDQREWARWLVDRGADVVAGAHPHVTQPLDFYRGKPIAYSLGNLIFPKSLGTLGKGAWLELSFAADGRLLSVEQVGNQSPVQETLRSPDRADQAQQANQ